MNVAYIRPSDHRLDIKLITAIPGSSLPFPLVTNVCHLMPRSFHSFSPCIVARTFLLCFIFRNSRNQTPCQVPVASFPFDIGIVTLAPIKDDLICAYHITESAICPQVVEWRPIYRHVVAALCIVPVQPFSSCSCNSLDELEMLSLPRFEALFVLRYSAFQRTFVFFHYPVQRITHIRPHIIVPILIH